MKTVGLRELRQDASRLVREAEAGAEIIITMSGRPSARLVPAETRHWRSFDALQDLFHGPADEQWAQDRELINDTVRDPWSAQ